MDDTLRMDHDFDLVGPHAEQITGLDHFERLVHHGGGIDRDLAAHHPVRMRASLVWRHIAQCGRVAIAERPARSGQDQLVDQPLPGLWIVGQGLEDGRVFTVDRQQFCTAVRHSLHEHLAADHQRFLVG